MSSPSVSTFQPGMVGSSMARLVLPQARRERRRDVVHLPLRRGELEDQHVLGQPALVAGHRRWRSAASSTSCRAASCRRSRSRSDQISRVSGKWEMYLVVVARPGHVGLARLQRRADRVQRRHEVGVRRPSRPAPRVPIRVMIRIEATTYALSVISTPNIGLSALERAHAERDHVHRPAAHAAAVQLGHPGLHLGRGHPVVGRAGVGLVDRADEGALLDPGHVGRVGAGPERVGLLLRVEPDQGARRRPARR